MDPKEVNRPVESSSTGVSQPVTKPFVSTKSLIPVTAVLQKNTNSSLTGCKPPKILSRNSNGTVVLTSSPNNEAEVQLYRVMQRASLLAYYDTLLEMGGDDVQQLCDAGKEEFLEIMSLVGMASKPLHVRRFQKALQEWIATPALFQTSLPSSQPTDAVPQLCGTRSDLSSGARSRNFLASPSNSGIPPAKLGLPSTSSNPNQAVADVNCHRESSVREASPSPTIASQGSPRSPSHVTPVLVESQIAKLAEVAETLAKTLPQFEPKPQNTKKKICRDLEIVMNMAEDDPRRMDEIRKYAAIYGRFDCKRNPQKPLTLHEVSVNEAAAQMCRFLPALLTRRDDLFALARQVVRDSGYHYIKGQSSIVQSLTAKTHSCLTSGLQAEENHCSKKVKTTDNLDADKCRRRERLEQIAEELRILGEKTEELVRASQQIRQTNDLSSVQSLQQEMEAVQSKQTQLLIEQSELLKQPLPSRFYRRNGNRVLPNHTDSEKNDIDETDSQFSLSNASSPSQEAGDLRDSLLRDGDNFSNSNGSPPVKTPRKTSKQAGRG